MTFIFFQTPKLISMQILNGGQPGSPIIPDTTSFIFGFGAFDISPFVAGQTFEFNGNLAFTSNLVDDPVYQIDRLPHSVTVNSSELNDCFSTTDCEEGFACIHQIEECSFENQPGACVEQIEDVCSIEYDTVCGCDGQTYMNSCQANIQNNSEDFIRWYMDMFKLSKKRSWIEKSTLEWYSEAESAPIRSAVKF